MISPLVATILVDVSENQIYDMMVCWKYQLMLGFIAYISAFCRQPPTLNRP